MRTVIFLLLILFVGTLFVEEVRVRELKAKLALAQDNFSGMAILVNEKQVMQAKLDESHLRITSLEASTGSADTRVRALAMRLLLKTCCEINLPELISTVPPSAGRRYGKVTCALWMSRADASMMGLLDHRTEIAKGTFPLTRTLQVDLQTAMHHHDIDELKGSSIIQILQREFSDVVEKDLHQAFPASPVDHHFVEELVLSDFKVQ